MRAPAVVCWIWLPLIPLVVLRAQHVPQPSAAPLDSRLYYYATPRSTLEAEVHSVPATNQARLEHLQALFSDRGCTGNQLRVQPIGDKAGSPANLICTWPGNTASTVVVLAEYEHEGKGQSAVENWSGAALLPYLYFGMQARPRENNWVFVESGSRSGATAYVRSLTAEQKKQIRAVVVLDSLGVSPATRFFTAYPESPFLPAPVVHLQMALALASLSDPRAPRPEFLSPERWIPSDDTQPFRYSHVPCILLHSIAESDASLPGSVRDTPEAIDGNSYYSNYRTVAVFLVGLDALAGKLLHDDPIWHGQGTQFGLNPNDLPILR